MQWGLLGVVAGICQATMRPAACEKDINACSRCADAKHDAICLLATASITQRSKHPAPALASSSCHASITIARSAAAARVYQLATVSATYLCVYACDQMLQLRLYARVAPSGILDIRDMRIHSMRQHLKLLFACAFTSWRAKEAVISHPPSMCTCWPLLSPS